MKAKLLISRYFALHNVAILTVFSLAFSSCSHRPAVSDSEMISKKEYEELEKKYKELLEEKKSSAIPEINVETKGDELFLSTSEEVLAPDLNSQMKTLDQVQEMIVKGDYEQAMNTLKGLTNSSFKQIKVRAKFYQGEIWFSQKEFDLALQIYDEIINKYGFSSVAIKAIERSEACKKNLNLPSKQEQYHSIFTDLSNS